MIRLPWVSREQYEDMRDSRDYERENAQWLRREIASTRRASELASLESFPRAPEPVDVPQAIVILPDPIREVIREQAEQGGRDSHALASHLRQYARQLKREGKSDDEIVGLLVQWQTSEVSIP